jgi:hypothetical protein
MPAAPLLLLAATLAISSPTTSHAGTNRPVYVEVTGQSAIRFRLALGQAAPCDSSEDRMLFDGVLPPGKYVFETGSETVCYQHTYPDFPAVGWSVAQVMPTRIRRRGPLSLAIP